MGIALLDSQADGPSFAVSFWDWRAIVEEVRRLGVLPESVVDGLHNPFSGGGLSREQARLVARELRVRVIPHLGAGERVLFDGTRTTEPDDGVFHKQPSEEHLNYSTDREALTRFAEYCERTAGFKVC